jgi:hypothetical protein
LYAFAVLALAAFVLIVSLRREGKPRFQAAAVLHCVPVDQDPPPETRQLQDWLTDATSLQHAIDHVQLSVPDVAVQLDPASVAKRLVLRSKPRPGQSLAFDVSYTGSNDVVAMALVNRICNQLVHERKLAREKAANDATRDIYAVAVQRRQQAERALHDAEERLKAFLEASFTALQAAPTKAAEPQESPGEDPRVEVEPTRLAKLITRLETLEREREEHLERMTLQHPRVIELAAEITALQSQIERVREQNQDLTELADHPIAGRANGGETDQDKMRRQSLADEHLELKQAVERTEGALAAAREEELRQRKALHHRQPSPSWHVDPAVAARALPRSVPPSVILMATVLGMTTSGGLLLAFGGSQTIGCTADAESVLALPVLGTVTVPALARHETAALSPTPRQWLVYGAETVLSVFILAMVLSAVLDGSFASQLRGNPLAALTDGVGHLWHAIWR